MHDNKKDANLLGAVITGAAIGAAAVFLSNQENRKKIRRTINGIKKDGAKRLKDLQDKAEDVTEQGRQKLAAEIEDVQERLEKRGKKSRTNGSRIARA